MARGRPWSRGSSVSVRATAVCILAVRGRRGCRIRGGMKGRNAGARIEELKGQRWTEQEAREVLAAWKSSRLSMTAFARTHGLSGQRLSWWRKKLDDEKAPAAEEFRFAPVVLTGVGTRPAAVVRVGGVEVDVHDPDKVSVEWLVALTRAMERA